MSILAGFDEGSCEAAGQAGVQMLRKLPSGMESKEWKASLT